LCAVCLCDGLGNSSSAPCGTKTAPARDGSAVPPGPRYWFPDNPALAADLCLHVLVLWCHSRLPITAASARLLLVSSSSVSGCSVFAIPALCRVLGLSDQVIKGAYRARQARIPTSRRLFTLDLKLYRTRKWRTTDSRRWRCRGSSGMFSFSHLSFPPLNCCLS
jgi:hypothetical protein